jgi:hypothetical protein
VRVSAPSVRDATNSVEFREFAPNESFVGEWVYAPDVAAVSVSVYSLLDSATDGLVLWWSFAVDESDEALRFTHHLGPGKTYVAGPRGDYFRVSYLNGAGSGSFVRIHTTLHYKDVRADTVRIAEDGSVDSSATLVKSVLAGISVEDGSLRYRNVSVTQNGALYVFGNVSSGADGNNNDGAPGSSTQIGGPDESGNLQAAHVFDGDAGAGTQYVLGAILRKSASGGTVEAGTASNPLRTDPTGTTSQPISATSLPLPAGAATEATLATRVAEATFAARINTQGQKAMAGSTPVVLASDQTPVSIADGGGSITVDTPQLPAALVGSRLDVNSGAWLGSTAPTVGQKTMAASLPVVVSSDQTALPITAASLPLPTGAATEATLATRLAEATFTSRVNTLGQKAMADSTPVVLASDQSSLPISDGGGSLTIDGAITANIGTTNGLALDATLTGGAARTRITDGTSNAAVKAASTPAVAADPALVVAFSPNNTVVTSNASVATNNGAVPSFSTHIGGTDGSTLRGIRVFDGDTGAGTQFVLGAILRKGAAGGTVEAGTATDPLRVDPTGTTSQPISATSLPLPTGAATEATLATRLADATFTARVNTLGQKAMADSTPVVLASDQTSIPISDGGGSLTIDGTVTANIGTTNGLALDATLTGGTQRTRITDGTSNAAVKPASTAALATDPALVVAISPNNPVATSNLSVGLNNAALPTSSTEIGGSDGTNLQAIRVFDADSGAGTQYVLGATLRKTASGGSVEAGTATDPLRVDPTGTTTQPISAVSLPLPAGAATEATLATRLADATFTARINTLGQKTAASSTPVVLASDQSPLAITDNGGSITVDTPQLPAALVGGRLDTNNGAWLGSTAPTVGQKTMANSVPIVIASDQTPSPTAVVGTHANAWNAVSTGTNGNSTAIDCQYTPYVSVFGTVNGTTTISIQVSQNNTNFYTVDSITISSLGGGDFGGNYMIGARYVRLQSGTSRTATATIAGKA